MCGIAGFLAPKAQFDQVALDRTVTAMASTLQHRGPDDAGTWCDPTRGVALGHQRLAILDLSEAGRQPMESPSGRYVIVYNGEIYNHREIRRTLPVPDSRFQGHSDTESLLASIDHQGIEKTLENANGMFAFALWDRQTRRLTLARDRLGIKPLYYGWVEGQFLFGSELKALRKHPTFRGEIDRAAVAIFLQHNYIPAPFSIYRGIRKLPPGTFLTVSAAEEGEDTDPKAYWTLKEIVALGKAAPFDGTPDEAVDQLNSLLADAVQLRTLSDVPLGAFLSGGVDSTTIAALMQSDQAPSARTFSIGFHETDYDEAPAARAIAQHLGTQHVEHYVTAREALEVVPLLPHLYDEPFADSSQIPTYLVSKLARQHVTVSLSGDGGDELFGGYERYRRMERLWNGLRHVPSRLRTGAAKFLSTCLPARGGGSVLRKLRTLATFLDARDGRHLYTRFHTHWKDPGAVVVDGTLPVTPFYQCDDWARCDEFLEEMMYIDTMTYLPDDILVKVDRASMSVGLEARVPFLDHRVVQWAWTVPACLKIHNGSGKWILREMLDRHVPRQMMSRPKRGFGVPIDHWLRGPLREWAENLLAEPRLRSEGFFHPTRIRQLWQQHLDGEQDWHYYLWDVLMFQAWLESSTATW